MSPEDGGHETGGLVDMLFFLDDAARISSGDDRDGKTVSLITNRKPDKINPKDKVLWYPEGPFLFFWASLRGGLNGSGKNND